jgi:uncharacterized protein (DUF4415 family)
MRKVVAEKYRDIDFSRAKRGAVVPLEPGKTKISIRLDNKILEYFRGLVEKAGGGNYQSLINEALLEHIYTRSTLEIVRQAVREELAPYSSAQAFDVAPERAAVVRNRRRGRIPFLGRPVGSGPRRPPSTE